MGINENAPYIIDVGGNRGNDSLMGALFSLLGMNGNGGFGGMGGMFFLIVIVVLVLLVGGGGLWGGNRNNGGDYAMAAALASGANGAFTRNEVGNGFATQEINNGIRGIQNGLCDGFYAQNTTMLQGFNGLGRDVLENRFALGAAIAENRFAVQNCCCETNRNIDAVRYEAAQNTCAITTNATANTQKILDKLCVMESNAKDAQIADLREKLAVANLQVSQQVQSTNLIGALRPFPQPAYITCSPYQSATHSYNGYGGCGCGCGVTA